MGQFIRRDRISCIHMVSEFELCGAHIGGCEITSAVISEFRISSTCLIRSREQNVGNIAR